MAHPNEPTLTALKELLKVTTDPKRVHALTCQIKRREQEDPNAN